MDVLLLLAGLYIAYSIYESLTSPSRRYMTVEELKEELASHHAGNEKYMG